MKNTVALLALLCISAGPAENTDWSQFRGPNRDGVSPDSGLLKQWPASGPAVECEGSDMGPMVAPGPEGQETPERADRLAELTLGEWPLTAPPEPVVVLHLAIPGRCDPVDVVAVDDDRPNVVPMMDGAVVVLDPGVGQRHHRLPAPDGDEGRRTGQRMQVAADLIRAQLHRQRMEHRPAAPASFATRTRRVDEQDLLATNLDLPRLEGTGVAEPLDHDVDELDLFVLVEQVGHAIGGQAYPARQHAVLGVGDEVDHGVPNTRRIREGDGVAGFRSRSLEGEEEASAGVVDHGAIVGP